MPDKSYGPEHVTDGQAMFREAAAQLAPGRTVATQIRAVASALYGAARQIGWRRTKACCYGEACPPTVLDFKYRFEAWRRGVVTRSEARADQNVKTLTERLDKLEAALAKSSEIRGEDLDR